MPSRRARQAGGQRRAAQEERQAVVVPREVYTQLAATLAAAAPDEAEVTQELHQYQLAVEEKDAGGHQVDPEPIQLAVGPNGELAAGPGGGLVVGRDERPRNNPAGRRAGGRVNDIRINLAPYAIEAAQASLRPATLALYRKYILFCKPSLTLTF